MTYSTTFKAKCYDHTKVNPHPLVVIFDRAVDRIQKLEREGRIDHMGAGGGTGGGWAHFYDKKRRKGVTINSCYGWDNYDQPNERYWVSFSITFYFLTKP